MTNGQMLLSCAHKSPIDFLIHIVNIAQFSRSIDNTCIEHFKSTNKKKVIKLHTQWFSVHMTSTHFLVYINEKCVFHFPLQKHIIVWQSYAEDITFFHIRCTHNFNVSELCWTKSFMCKLFPIKLGVGIYKRNGRA